MSNAQSYSNHFRFRPAHHYFVVPVLLAHFFVQVWGLWQQPTIAQAWTMVVAAALLTAAHVAREQALTAQDRIIRLEMLLRLQRVLPADLQARISELKPRQLVALRFASDAELPALMRDVLSGSLTKSGEIKKKVRDWQGDYLRV
ncbi:MAG: hypothetical protein HOP16_14355 [Acidobacteria bacterium]|nr:hypothetical protein [Acidobacteriota bacterium]